MKDRKKKFALIGKPDTVWFGDIDDTAVNVVVVEAKSHDHASIGVPQCLAYMGQCLMI